MLKVYTGYNLNNLKEIRSFEFTDLTPPDEIIEIITKVVNESNCFSDNGMDLKIKSNHPLVLATLETLAMESGFNNHMIYYYINEQGEYSSSHYEGELIVGDYFPNSELLELKSRFFSKFYKKKTKFCFKYYQNIY